MRRVLHPRTNWNYASARASRQTNYNVAKRKTPLGIDAKKKQQQKQPSAFQHAGSV